MSFVYAQDLGSGLRHSSPSSSRVAKGSAKTRMPGPDTTVIYRRNHPFTTFHQGGAEASR
jgi:hypothetical protein